MAASPTANLPVPAPASGSDASRGRSNPPLPRHRVLILCPYPRGGAPGQRFRYEQYLDRLATAGCELDLAPFLDPGTAAILYAPGRRLRKIWGVLRGFCRRLRRSLRLRSYHRIFIFREAAPLGPPLIEWLAFCSRVPVTYDFDDAIFLDNVSAANSWIARLKWPSKVAYIVRHSGCVVVSNRFLADWARPRNPNIHLIPTTVDLDYHRSQRNRAVPGPLPVLGWTGSHSTARYLDLIRPALQELQRRFDFVFLVICDRDPGFPQQRNYRFLPWRLHTEIADLDLMDIGLMPVPEGAWENGKVGFKAIQYGAMEIPTVASNTGSGPEVVENGVTGLTVDNTTAAWVEALAALLLDPGRAAALGRAARGRIARQYSCASQAAAYLEVFGAPALGNS